jgi:hypothetical protein
MNTPNALSIMTDEYRKQSEVVAQLILRIADLEDANSALRREMTEQASEDTDAADTPTTDTTPVEVASVEVAPIDTAPIAPVTLTGLALSESPNKDAKRETALWKRAVGDIKDPCTIDEFWQHVIQYTNARECTDGTRKKEMGVIAGFRKRLDIPVSVEFEAMRTILRAKVEGAKSGDVMPVDELVTKFGCADGTLLTTQKLQDKVKAELALPTHTPANTRALMALALFAFHGNRPQDWVATRGAAVKYGAANYVEGDYGYYEPTTRTMHLFDGKHKGRGIVCFPVEDEVAQATAMFHALHPNQTYFFPLQNGKMAETKLILDTLKASYFAPGNARGFPVGITPTDMRHLYELHIRHVLKLDQTKLDRIFKVIGHCNKTSVLWYSETYKNILEFKQSSFVKTSVLW